MTAYSQVDPKTNLVLRIHFFWRILFAILAAAGAVYIWVGGMETALWQKILISVALAMASIFSAIGAVQISRRNHSGRMISLVLDYLAFVVCFVLMLNTGEIFIGIDALAETFPKGIPYLGITVVGYFLSIMDEYLPQKKQTSENSLKVVGRWVMLAGFAIFLLQVDAINGIIYFLGKLVQPMGITSVIGAVIFSISIWSMMRDNVSQALHAKTDHEQVINGWLFLSPNLLGFLIFFAGPLILSFYFSFTDSDAFNTPNWIGFENYAKILNVRFAWLSTPDQFAREVVDIKVYDEVGRFLIGDGGILFAAADKFFWLALRNTLVFVLFAVPLSVIPALVLSNVLNSKLPGMKFYRAIYFMPSIAAVVGISLVWQWLYNATVGYINYFITVGIEFWNNLFNLAVVDPKIQWVSDEKTALLSIIIIAAWQTMGFNTVLFLAGLQNIPGELYEAATVDGAGAWDKFWSITLPMLAPTTFYVVSTTTIQAMQVFEQVFILMNPAEGPNNSTITLVLYLYRSGFQNFQQGYASAIAWVLFIVIFGITLVQFQRQRQSSIYES
ncbi:sugar ABC transporter permease [Candidatus Villigracilis affinis]|uniref:carbohydrate ABC transporter permease n=1 Tax=Candidatus Villigracilis affinis TaxID=3140682 RepID=UPI001DE09B58|nr:sugar ABC transporter permease [Anaerolineales bacterium]